ncbi:hypothetical protein CI610_00154 [invertebrate metagenome]|uniref:Uncharacterized protein n=1 Tax=invertebrate metagenome TaxID=1711999 RepID=A0A2H9TC38_9ZZZZ
MVFQGHGIVYDTEYQSHLLNLLCAACLKGSHALKFCIIVAALARHPVLFFCSNCPARNRIIKFDGYQSEKKQG